jgi:hypothetical protein
VVEERRYIWMYIYDSPGVALGATSGIQPRPRVHQSTADCKHSQDRQSFKTRLTTPSTVSNKLTNAQDVRPTAASDGSAHRKFFFVGPIPQLSTRSLTIPPLSFSLPLCPGCCDRSSWISSRMSSSNISKLVNWFTSGYTITPNSDWKERSSYVDSALGR